MRIHGRSTVRKGPNGSTNRGYRKNTTDGSLALSNFKRKYIVILGI